jgi:hypothetical protein
MKAIYILLLFVLTVFANDFIEKKVQIKNTTAREAIIDLGNLKIGQSGIILHIESDGKPVIVSYGIISSSDKNSSVISLRFKDVLLQDAFPKTNLKPKDGDIFVLNHLYKNSMIVAPNFEALSKVKENFVGLNFIDSDFFAAYLKINNNPTPTKEDIKQFAYQNDLGRVFVVVDKMIYVVDMVSFQIVDAKPLIYNDNTFASPFYANIDNIKTAAFNFFGAKEILNYDMYYKKLLGLKDGK